MAFFIVESLEPGIYPVGGEVRETVSHAPWLTILFERTFR